MRRWRARDTVAMVFVTAGVLHFAIPAPYIAIVPPWLPAAPTLVAVSGLAEIAGGIGVLDPRTKRLAGWGLIALLIAVFPANVYMLQAAMTRGAHPAWVLALWLRLPVQLLLVWWVWRVAARAPKPAA